MKLVGGQGILVEVTSVWLADPPTFVFQLSQYANVFLSLGHAFWFLSWYRGLLSLCVGHSLAKAQAGSQFVAGCRPSQLCPRVQHMPSHSRCKMATLRLATCERGILKETDPVWAALSAEENTALQLTVTCCMEIAQMATKVE